MAASSPALIKYQGPDYNIVFRVNNEEVLADFYQGQNKVETYSLDSSAFRILPETVNGKPFHLAANPKKTLLTTQV